MGEDVQEFRRALGQFATGVAVISAPAPGGVTVWLTVRTFNSVSLQPPLVLFSIARAVGSLPALRAAPGYAVSILSKDQQQLSNRFAQPRTKKWSNVRQIAGVSSAPLIERTLASFECEPYAEHDGGDHVIFVGRVVRFHVMSDDNPLLFLAAPTAAFVRNNRPNGCYQSTTSRNVTWSSSPC